VDDRKLFWKKNPKFIFFGRSIVYGLSGSILTCNGSNYSVNKKRNHPLTTCPMQSRVPWQNCGVWKFLVEEEGKPGRNSHWSGAPILSQSSHRDKARGSDGEIASRIKMILEARVGIEPTHKGFADLSLTTWVPRPVEY
jgi:hypothetical protein